MNVFVGFMMKLLSTELTKTVIGYAVKKLLEAKSDGITKEIATVMIEGIAKSKANPTTTDMVQDVLGVLK